MDRICGFEAEGWIESGDGGIVLGKREGDGGAADRDPERTIDQLSDSKYGAQYGMYEITFTHRTRVSRKHIQRARCMVHSFNRLFELHPRPQRGGFSKPSISQARAHLSARRRVLKPFSNASIHPLHSSILFPHHNLLLPKNRQSKIEASPKFGGEQRK